MNNFASPQNNGRKRHIEGEQPSVANTRILYEDVVRKNQQIIKQILSKINDLYSRQEDFDHSIRSINEKITRINETAEQLHHQFRANHVEIQRKHQGIINDLNGLKGTLKIPDMNKEHQQYLESQFFKQHTAMVSNRSRSRKKIRHKTNFKGHEETRKMDKIKKTENQISIDMNGKMKRFSQIKKVGKIENEKEDFFQQQNKNQLSNTFVGGQSKFFRQQGDIEVLITKKMNQLQEKLQFDLNNSKDQVRIMKMQLSETITNLENEMQRKMQNMPKHLHRENNWSQVNFQELYHQFQGKFKEQLKETLNKKYFQESLVNLKQSWQQVLNEVYNEMNTKLSKQNLQAIEEKITQLRTQIQILNNSSIAKLQNNSYNSTCKSTPYRLSPTQRSSNEDIFDRLLTSRQEYQPKMSKKNKMFLSNSYASFSRTKENKRTIIEEKDCILKSDQESEAQWKRRAMQTLGLANKKVRKINKPQ